MRLVDMTFARSQLTDRRTLAHIAEQVRAAVETLPVDPDMGSHEIRLTVILSSGRHIGLEPDPDAEPLGVGAINLAALYKVRDKIRPGRAPQVTEFLRTLRRDMPGYGAVAKCWPSYLLVDPEKRVVAAVDLARARGRVLKGIRRACLQVLAKIGLPAYRWETEEGFTRIGMDNKGEVDALEDQE